MSDMTKIITPKSDQLNSDDLISGPRTIKISRVEIRGGQEQPISIFYDGDNGKPYKACKSMCRVLVMAWGADSKQYVGRSMTLYRDSKVKWAGIEVGGIRISHLSHIDEPLALMLTASKGSKKPHTVNILKSGAEVPGTGDDRRAMGTPHNTSAPSSNLELDRAKAKFRDAMKAAIGHAPTVLEIQAWLYQNKLSPEEKLNIAAASAEDLTMLAELVLKKITP